MKTITWSEFFDIVKSGDSLINWNDTLCDISYSDKMVQFLYEEDECNYYNCDIESCKNSEIEVKGNTFTLFDSETNENIEIEIFRKVPWIIE